MNLKTKQKGFTLVELLIVIVVIAILAAISIVAYNGIQNRAKTTSAAASAATVVKKEEAAKAITSSYPASQGDFAAQKDSDLAGSGITLLSAAPTANSKPSEVSYEKCTVPANTNLARVRVWDYGAGAAAAYNYLGGTSSSSCTTWAFVSGGPY